MKLVFVFIMFAKLTFAASPSVVIIGGGPAGLSSAIEAKQAGASVKVIEKRGAYEREQMLFLFEHSLDLLKKWKAAPAGLSVVGVGDRRIGFVQISELENALLHRAKELGVEVIQDQFVGFSKKGRLARLKKTGSIPYDLLIAADGVHSLVRQSIGIELDRLSQGKAGAAFFLLGKDQPPNPIEVLPHVQHGSSFVRKFQFPELTLVFLQGPQSATKEDFIRLCKASGWDLQAKQVAANEALLLLDVDVFLQRATRFSLKDRGVLLIGDAAATGSFFRGKGANYALESAEIAGRFFQTNDYERFEVELNQATDVLVEDNAFLFQHEESQQR